MSPTVADDHIEKPVFAFIEGRFPDIELGPEDDIFALGFVNSLFAMQLVMFVEKEFGVAVEDEDLDLDNFRSVDAIARLIERKTVAVAGD